MNTPAELYPLRGADGEIDDTLTPHGIIKQIVIDGLSPARAWREYLGLLFDQGDRQVDRSTRPLISAIWSGPLADTLRVRLLSMAQHRPAPMIASARHGTRAAPGRAPDARLTQQT